MSHRFLIFVAIVQAILWLGHTLLWAAVVVFFGLDKGTSAAVLGTLSITFVSSTLLAWQYHNWLTRIYYRLSAVWLGVGHVLLMASLMAWLALGIVSIIGAVAGPHTNGTLSNAPLAIGSVLLGMSSVVAAYGLTFARRVRTTSYKVNLPSLPFAWRNRKAVWISDLHLGHINGPRFARAVARKVNRLQPDIVFIGGDLFDGADGEIPALLAPITDISAPLGVYFITGNHEEFTKPEHFLGPIRATGAIKILLNEAVDIDGLRIVGVDYAATTNPDRYHRILAPLIPTDDTPAILLKHDPSHLHISEALGISLQISGHTHEGQIFPFNFITHRVYGEHDYGLSRSGSLQLLTSSGAGTWGPPMRLGTRSEIVEIRFE